ncbi:4Fe-4S dicluster domain-containing protein [Azospirillum sp. TSO35-2]|uniref:4Fe-4S dicluster domain-containing protein n=1 Tax=Azospirillum sp. TSO35-2 TaxID=716796 RepID=UPI001FFE54C6|nr:4Fe-4S dicluster domain-containing protein [Azospirillum sp. TSO35-2]
MAACTEIHKKAGLQAHPRLTVMRIADDTAPVLCHQCEDAPCARVCPVNAITHAADAIVLDEKICIGCKMCALACPFGAITPSGTSVAGVAGIRTATPTQPAALDPLLAWEIGVKSVAVKCDLCAFASDGPACVRVCPTAALYTVDAATAGQAAAVKRTLAAAAPVSLERTPAALEGLDP